MSEAKSFFIKLTKHGTGLIGLIIVLTIIAISIIVALTGSALLPYDPIEQNVGEPMESPSLKHFFGTDKLGRDLFSRVIYATPNDFFVSFSVIVTALIIGLVIGTYSALKGGIVDEILMRIIEVFMAIPALVLAMAVAVALGAGVINMMYALMFVWWPWYTRMARGETLRIVNSKYIEAAVGSGVNNFKIMLRHLIPNIFPTMLVFATIDFGQVILIYSGLSYLGLSVSPPWPDWGEMVNSYQNYLVYAPWLPLFPGMIIATVVIGFGLLGDGIRDALELK